jgi:hypothetical protein
LWIDTADVSFLQEDEQDEATIRETRARAIRTLLDAGYDPDAAAQYVATGDVSVLVGSHSGLFSVQLQPAGADQAQPARALEPAAEMRHDTHIHLPESVDIELRQDRVVDMLEQFGNAINAIEARTAMADERMANMPAPIVNVAAPNVTVNVPETPVQLTLDMPTPVINIPAPQVTVMDRPDDGPSKKVVKFNKDSDGRITGATVIED